MNLKMFCTTIVVLTSMMAVAQDTSTLQTRPPASQPADRLEIGAGDLVDVEVFDTPELSAGKVRVDEEGTIKLPVVGQIQLKGLTPTQASKKIEDLLRDSKVMLDPHVTVLVTEYATAGVRVLGQVKNPGSYVLLGPHSLYDALAAAGGTNPEQGEKIVVTHESDPAHPETLDVNSPNYSAEERLKQVQPGDVVVVSRAGAVYVLGDVTHPGEYSISNGQPFTVLQALALAQGTSRFAKMTKASILRKTNDGTITIPLNLKKIEENTATNIALQSTDILIVPHSAVKQFLETALPLVTGDLVGTSVGVAIAR
jgi:polysaccharide export outer membrane protein